MSIQAFSPNCKNRLQLIVMILFCVIATGCATAKQDRQISGLYFKTLNKQHSMHYAYSGDISKPGVLFIHGTPGSWSAFVDYLDNKKLQQQFFMVSVDRPNWGTSEHQPVFNFDSQADAIHTVMQNYPNKQWVLVGHSLGASIAPKLALKYPSSVSGLLLLAGTLSPALGKPRWYNSLANNVLINWLVPADLKAANIEIMALENELSILHKELTSTQLDSNVVVIQGMKDKLVSPKNAKFIASQWNDRIKKLTVIELDDAGHFLPWRQTDLVIEQIKQLSNH